MYTTTIILSLGVSFSVARNISTNGITTNSSLEEAEECQILGSRAMEVLNENKWTTLHEIRRQGAADNAEMADRIFQSIMKDLETVPISLHWDEEKISKVNVEKQRREILNLHENVLRKIQQDLTASSVDTKRGIEKKLSDFFEKVNLKMDDLIKCLERPQ